MAGRRKHSSRRGRQRLDSRPRLPSNSKLRTPARLAISAVEAIAGSILFLLLLWGVRRGYRVLSVKMPRKEQNETAAILGRRGPSARSRDEGRRDSSRFYFTRRGFRRALSVISWVTFAAAIPYTGRGVSRSVSFCSRMGAVALAIIYWIPDLFTIIVIVLMTPGGLRFIYVLFAAVEQDRLHVPGVYPKPRRRHADWLSGFSGSSRSSRPIRICRAASQRRSKASACSSAWSSRSARAASSARR